MLDHPLKPSRIGIGAERNIQALHQRTALREHAAGGVRHRRQPGDVYVHQLRIPHDDEVDDRSLELAAFQRRRDEVSADVRDRFDSPILLELDTPAVRTRCQRTRQEPPSS